MKLKIAEDLSLPVELVTQTLAIVAKRRVGKSYTMRRIAEQLFKAGQQVVIVDPKGDQWGIRSAADGKAPGLPFVILGGERADVPLEVGAGAVVAKLLVEERVSAVLDLSLFRKREVAHFMGGPTPPREKEEGFLEVLYRLKAMEKFRTPMTLILDEADAIAPQSPQQGEERMLGAAEDIVRRGGQRGLGCIVVTQRTAVLNKNVLTQAEILVALRTIAPQDLKAMNAWFDVHGTVEEKKTLMESLPSLPIGDAWFWSPGWPTGAGIFKRVHVLPIETFDSGATPKPGERRKEPKTVADVDLEALSRQMAETIERQKADDPRELRKAIDDYRRKLRAIETEARESNARVGLLEARLAQKDEKAAGKSNTEEVRTLKAELARHRRVLEAAMKIVVKVKALEFNIEAPEDKAALEQAIAAAVRQITGPVEKRITGLAGRVEGIKKQAAAAEAAIAELLEQKLELAVTVQKSEPLTVTPPRAPASPRAPKASPSVNGAVTGPQQRILNALAWGEGMRLPLPRKEKVAFLADASPTSSAFANNLGALRTAGYIDYPAAGFISLTDAGRAIAQTDDDAPRTSDELQSAICAKLPGPQSRIVRELVRVYPTALAKVDLADRAQASATSSAFANNLGSLRSLGLIDYPQQGMVAAQPVLFLEER